MTWLALLALAVLTLAPLAWTVLRGGRLRGRRDAALALHQAQLGELDRDLAEHRLLPAEHVAAKLEVQRRLLAEADTAEAGARSSGPLVLVLTGALVPAVALVLYAAHGTPDYRQAAELAQANLHAQASVEDEAMIGRLRATLATMDPHAEETRRGYVMLGRAELSMGHLHEAADAWRSALAVRFEPDLGAETAEVITEADAQVTPEAAGLFKRALAEAPADAPWRQDVTRRLAGTEVKARGSAPGPR